MMAENTENEEKSAKKSGLMTLIKAVAFVSVIVLMEIAAVSMFIPSVGDTEEIANQLAAADAAQESDSNNEAAAMETATGPLASGDLREVSLDDFHVVTYDPDTGSSLNVDFKLFGTVLADDEGEFFDLYGASANRISEQITITVRGTDPADLTAPELGLIKRKILEKTNRALGKPLLHEVIFTDFSFIER